MKRSFKRKSGKRGPVRAKKVSYDGIDFASGLEKYMWIALKKAGIKAKYEGETFAVVGDTKPLFEHTVAEIKLKLQASTGTKAICFWGKSRNDDAGNLKNMAIQFSQQVWSYKAPPLGK